METLADRVERDGPLNGADAAGWVIRLAKGVERLHQLGVAHGGVSANVVSTEGAACTCRGVLGDVRQAAIRPAYHCPERHTGEGVSQGDDVWGVAVTLYYLITGQLPFSGQTTRELAEQIRTLTPAPLAVFDAGDDALQVIIDRVMMGDRSRRIGTMAELRALIEAWHPDPIAAQLPPLDECDDDWSGDAGFDDDDADDGVPTVMRDFGDVKDQLMALGAMPDPCADTPLDDDLAPPPLGAAFPLSPVSPLSRSPIVPSPVAQAVAGHGPADRRAKVGTEAGSDVRNTILGGFQIPALVDPSAVSQPQQAPALPSPPVAAKRVLPRPRPAAGQPSPRAANAQADLLQPAAPVHPPGSEQAQSSGLRPPRFDIVDDNSDSDVATVMVDVAGIDLSSAIQEALASKPPIAPGHPVGVAVPGSSIVDALAGLPVEAPPDLAARDTEWSHGAGSSAPPASAAPIPTRSNMDLERFLAEQPDNSASKRAVVVAVVLLLLVGAVVGVLLAGQNAIV